MKRYHSIEGLILAPVFAATVFFLKLSCPVKTGEGCFADIFFKIVFLPLPFLYKIFADNPVWIARHEALVLLIYWAIVGFFIGLAADIHHKK
jgi:hypothetical protein